MELFGLLPCLIFPLFAGLVVVLIVYSLQQAKKRRDAARRLAYETGYDFYAEDPWDIPTRYGHLDLMRHGHGKRAANVLCGQRDGREVVAFDYRYKTGSGKNETTHRHQAVIMTMPIAAPNLKVREEHVFDRVASWVGHDDIDFESDEFSRRYHVASDDRRFAYDVLHAQLIDYLLRCREVPAIQMHGNLLVLWDKHREVDNFTRLIEIADAILDYIPDYVLNTRGTDTR